MVRSEAGFRRGRRGNLDRHESKRLSRQGHGREVARRRIVRVLVPGQTREALERMREPPDPGLGWIAEVVIAAVTIANKLYQGKREKDKKKRAIRLSKAQDALVAEEALKAEAAATTARGALSPPSAAAAKRGGLVLLALGLGALFLFKRKARQ